MKTAIKYDYAIIIKVSLKSIKTGVAKGSIHCVTQKKFLLVSWTRSKKAVTARSYQKYKKDKVNFADEYAKQIRWKFFLLKVWFVEFLINIKVTYNFNMLSYDSYIPQKYEKTNMHNFL